MDWLKAIFSGGNIIDSIGNVADKFITTDEEKQKFKIEMEKLLHQRDNKLQDSLMTELQAKERVLVAELSQSDIFTKRARPSVVYFGLIIIALNHVIGPWAAYFSGNPIPSIELPSDFWVAWGGIVATWTIGRTFEKKGYSNKTIDTLTGGPKSIFNRRL